MSGRSPSSRMREEGCSLIYSYHWSSANRFESYMISLTYQVCLVKGQESLQMQKRLKQRKGFELGLIWHCIERINWVLLGEEPPEAYVKSQCCVLPASSVYFIAIYGEREGSFLNFIFTFY